MRAVLSGVALASLLGAATTAAAIAQPQQSPLARANAPAAQSWTVQVGAESADRGIQLLQFVPSQISVNVGDQITFTNPSPEIHTVTFLAPGDSRPEWDRRNTQLSQPQGGNQLDGSGFLNSGILDNGNTWSITTAAPGTYAYICLVHRQQAGTITVNPEGTPSAGSPDDLAASRAALEPIIAQWQSRLAGYQLREQPRPDGTREHVVFGGAGDGKAAVMRFAPQAVTVRVGDTVTWDNSDEETPHTVTFGPLAGDQREAWGTPSAFNGSDPLSSGFFGRNWPAGQTYSVTFTTPGQYSYICILHAPELMLGSITVTP